jgi:cell division protein FtsB
MNARKRQIFLITGIITLLVLLWLTLSPWGVVSFFRLRHDLAEMRTGNRELTETNRALEKEIDRLKNDRAYLEKVAREQYGLLKKNEVIYQYPPKKPAKP